MDYPCIFKYDTSDDTSYWMLILALENPQKIMLTHPGVTTYMHLLNRQNIGDSQSKWGYIWSRVPCSHPPHGMGGYDAPVVVYIHTYIPTYLPTYIPTYIHTYHYITLPYLTLPYITLPYIPYIHTYIPLHYLTLHYLTLPYITLPYIPYIHTYVHTYIYRHTHTDIHTYIPIHYITLHYLTLPYITLPYIPYIHTYCEWELGYSIIMFPCK